MSKSLRLSETWFNRGLWLIALIFAGFLIGLGSLIVGDLPRVESELRAEQFVDQNALRPIDTQLGIRDAQIADKETAIERLKPQAKNASDAFDEGKQSFDNWVETRKATGLSNQDGELIARTKELDTLKSAQSALQNQINVLEEQQSEIQRSRDAIGEQRARLFDAAEIKLDAQNRKQEMRVFLYRLLLTLPLLLIAGWLFLKKRKTRQWPFVWGFIFFALFTFFVELVPYLPSYGGYIRYIVGIIMTVIIGRYVINALHAYLERQRSEEQKPDTKRREELDYDLALGRLSKKVCPSCERPVALEDTERNFCTHCGICLFETCTGCNARKSAFARFCQACGFTPAAAVNASNPVDAAVTP